MSIRVNSKQAREPRLCDNGRRCGVGKVPVCDEVAVHEIHCIGGDIEAVLLCDKHFWAAFDAGLVSKPFMGRSLANANKQ